MTHSQGIKVRVHYISVYECFQGLSVHLLNLVIDLACDDMLYEGEEALEIPADQPPPEDQAYVHPPPVDKATL